MRSQARKDSMREVSISAHEHQRLNCEWLQTDRGVDKEKLGKLAKGCDTEDFEEEKIWTLSRSNPNRIIFRSSLVPFLQNVSLPIIGFSRCSRYYSLQTLWERWGPPGQRREKEGGGGGRKERDTREAGQKSSSSFHADHLKEDLLV